MTEQPPSAERSAPGGYVIEVEFDDGDEAQRAYDAIERLLGEMGQIGTLGMRPLPSALTSTGEQPDVWTEEDLRAADAKAEKLHRYFHPEEYAASPAAVVDYTERAREVIGRSCGEVVDYVHGSELLVNWRVNERLIVNIAAALSAAASERDAAPPPSVVDYTERALQAARDAVESVPTELWIDRRNSETIAQAIAPDFAEFASAVASERDAAAIRAFGQRVWSDSEEIAYQAGVSDTRARLREPDVREAVKDAIRPYIADEMTEAQWQEVIDAAADAALTKTAEMLK